MKYVDFSSLLEGEPADIAFLSTFQFDPDFFERRLLRSPALTKARRILVFMDARQWFDLLRRDVSARWLNRRYLVVPVRRPQGVFHPKLSLILTDRGGRVLCGSNNLTRSGCSSNLELLNDLPFDLEGDCRAQMDVAREAFAFFQHASKHADGEITRIATDWIEEVADKFGWLQEPVQADGREVKLLHTYDGGIWNRLVEHLNGDKPKAFLVISPFHDTNGDILRRLTTQWPRAQIELLVQQGYTNLDVASLRRLRHVALSELSLASRRLHAKLIAWSSQKGGGCIVGSANFTTAALDGRNIEACLLISPIDQLVGTLFDRSLAKQPLALDDFVAGEGEAPTPEPEVRLLQIHSALLTDANEVRVSYQHKFDRPPDSLRLMIRASGELRPRVSTNLPNKHQSTETAALSDGAFVDWNGTLFATLVAELDGKKFESQPVWVIQESRLTYEGGDGSSPSKNNVEETGEGLPEYIDELGRRDGVAAVVEYLRHLNIRFQAGVEGASGRRRLRLKIRDPFHPDVPPDWLIAVGTGLDDLEEAIYEFVDRHERSRLRKHVSLGNINGMENFVDIFTTLVRLLYVYFKRGVVKRGHLVGRVCNFITLATFGKDSDDEPFNGYLNSVLENLDGDVDLLREVCDETNYLAELRAALLIAQQVRFAPHEQPKSGPTASRPSEVLLTYGKAIANAITECGLTEPPAEQIQRALEAYRVFTEVEITRLLAELRTPGRTDSATGLRRQSSAEA
jgi:hypothetical protein